MSHVEPAPVPAATQHVLCLQLYTDEFYQTVVSRKLAPGGIFVTQSGPAGVISCTEVRKGMFVPLNPPCHCMLTLHPGGARLQHFRASAECWLGPRLQKLRPSAHALGHVTLMH